MSDNLNASIFALLSEDNLNRSIRNALEFFLKVFLSKMQINFVNYLSHLVSFKK